MQKRQRNGTDAAILPTTGKRYTLRLDDDHDAKRKPKFVVQCRFACRTTHTALTLTRIDPDDVGVDWKSGRKVLVALCVVTRVLTARQPRLEWVEEGPTLSVPVEGGGWQDYSVQGTRATVLRFTGKVGLLVVCPGHYSHSRPDLSRH